MWTAKKTNKWVINKAGVKRELLDTVKARKLAYYCYTMRKPGERDNARTNACTKAWNREGHWNENHNQFRPVPLKKIHSRPVPAS